jgi:hypothetical protein
MNFDEKVNQAGELARQMASLGGCQEPFITLLGSMIHLAGVLRAIHKMGLPESAGISRLLAALEGTIADATQAARKQDAETRSALN